MTAIIFGANGQDAFYLNKLLIKEKIQVHQVSRSGRFIKGNVGDYNFVETIIHKIQPTYIFHLAADSSISHKFLFSNHNSISNGTLHILESVKKHSPSSKVFLSGSAEQFLNKNNPIDENTPFHAKSSYASERIYSTYLARYYREAFQLKIFVGFFFHHDSPLRNENHLNQKIIQFVKRIKQKSVNNEKLFIGNKEIKKEFNFAGDIVAAVWLLVNQDIIFEVIIGSGEAFKIEKWLEISFLKVNEDWKNWIEVDNFFKVEYHTIVSNPNLLKSMGWMPKYDIYDLNELMFNI